MTEWVELKLRILAVGGPAAALPAVAFLAYSRWRHHCRHCPEVKLTLFPTFRLYGPAVWFGLFFGAVFGAGSTFGVPAGWGHWIWLLGALGMAVPWCLVAAALWCRWIDHDQTIHSPTRLTLALYCAASVGSVLSAEALQSLSA